MSEEVVDIVAVELAELAECEKFILDTVRASFEAGRMLHRVMDSRLYRHTYQSFEEWCKVKLHYSIRHCQRLMRECTSEQTIKTRWAADVELGNKRDMYVAPLAHLTPVVVRELTKLPVDKQYDVFVTAVASGEKVTAKTVKAAVVDFKRRTTPPPLPAPPPGGTLRPEVKAAIEEGAGRFAMLAARLVELSADFKKLFEEPVGVFVNPQEILAWLDGLKKTVRFAVPWSDCVHCGQIGCSECRGTGWLPWDRFEAAPAELRAGSLTQR